VAGSCEYGDEPSGSGAMELVSRYMGCKNRILTCLFLFTSHLFR
jgi:hypothetical protein